MPGSTRDGLAPHDLAAASGRRRILLAWHAPPGTSRFNLYRGTSAGAEVMKPLATPVLGGMVSSLLHVLVVTPVIFFWLRERELKKQNLDLG